MFKIIFFPFKLLSWFLKLSGVRGGLLLAVGVGVGMLLAPERGEVLRARLRARLDEMRAAPVPEAIDPVV